MTPLARSARSSCAPRAPRRRARRARRGRRRAAPSPQPRPEAVIHQLTSLPAADRPAPDQARLRPQRPAAHRGHADPRRRRPGAGAQRDLAQSIAFSYAPGPPGTLHGESDPLARTPPAPSRRSAHAAARRSSRPTLGRRRDGAALRLLLRPAAARSRRDGSIGQDLRRRRLPVVGGGAGVWSFIHIDDAARGDGGRARAAPPGVYNIVDDDPAPVSRVAARARRRRSARRAPHARPGLARPPARGRLRRRRDDPRPGRLERAAKRELGWAPAHRAGARASRAPLG